ncbi:MAG: hypothetical protein U1E76_22275 [Planctomycetota bacterium]
MFVSLAMVSVLWLAGAEGDSPSARPPVRDQMKAAQNLRRESFKKEPSEKRRLLLDAVKAYEQIVRDYPQARAEVAEAWFRQGEILRSLKEDAQATAAFAQVLELKDQPRFRARALIESGHLKRRAGDWKSAGTFYQQAMSDHKDQRPEYATAWTWFAKALLAQGQRKEGRERMLAFEAEFPEYPTRAIQNVDSAAVSLIEDGQVADAQSLIDGCTARFSDLAERETSVADDVHRALRRMHAPQRLGKAAKGAAPAAQDDDDDGD